MSLSGLRRLCASSLGAFVLDRTEMTFGDLGELFDGPHATPTRTPEGPYFLNISSLIDGRLDLDQSDHVSEVDFAKWTRRVTPKAEDLLFSYETRLGDVALMPPSVEACLGRRMALLRPNRAVVEPAFLLYFYLSPVFQDLIATHTIHGATVNRIGLSTMPAWPIAIPSLLEQRAIAEVLGALDEKISINVKFAKVADVYLAAELDVLIPGRNIDVPLATIASTNSLTRQPISGAKIRYVDIAAVGVGTHSVPEPIEWDDAPGRARRGLRHGDTLWSTVRPNRRSHSLNLSNDRDLVGSTGLAVLTPTNVGFAYLYEVTKRADFTSYLETVAEGSAYPAVRADRFGEAQVPLLPEGQRAAFESMAAPMREHLHSLSQENIQLAATRDALLPQLMSGKLRVKDAEKSLAGVL